MCIIPCSRNLNINWIQDVVCIHPSEKKEDGTSYSYAEIFSTIGIESQHETGRVDFILPSLSEAPTNISETIFDKGFFLSEFNQEISKQSISRTIETNFADKFLTIRFKDDSKFQGGHKIYQLLDKEADVQPSFPTKAIHKQTISSGMEIPYWVYSVKNIPKDGRFVLRFVYRTYPRDVIKGQQFYLLRGQDIATTELVNTIYSIGNQELKREYSTRLLSLSADKQDPQLDIYAMAMARKINYNYKGKTESMFKPDYIVVEGGEHYTPKAGNRNLKFNVIRKNPGEFENLVKVFYPMDGKFRIDLIVRTGMCDLHDILWSEHVKQPNV
jgi:hypothetical protein